MIYAHGGNLGKFYPPASSYILVPWLETSPSFSPRPSIFLPSQSGAGNSKQHLMLSVELLVGKGLSFFLCRKHLLQRWGLGLGSPSVNQRVGIGSSMLRVLEERTVCGNTGLSEKQQAPSRAGPGKHVSDPSYPPFVSFVYGDSKYSEPSCCAFNPDVTVWGPTEGRPMPRALPLSLHLSKLTNFMSSPCRSLLLASQATDDS